MTEEKQQLSSLFSVYAIRKNDQTPLIQTNLEFGHLMNDIIVPYDTGEMFFIDGAALLATDLDRIKIVRQKELFSKSFNNLHYTIRRSGSLEKQKLFAEQYHIRLEALLRELGEDVTAQVINAFRTAIKPKLKDYLPNKESMLNAAVKVFTESMKMLSNA